MCGAPWTPPPSKPGPQAGDRDSDSCDPTGAQGAVNGSEVVDEIGQVEVPGPLVGGPRGLAVRADRAVVLFGTGAFLSRSGRGEVGAKAVEVLVGSGDPGGERGAFGGVRVAGRAPAADGWGGELVEAALVGVALLDRALAELDEIEPLLLAERRGRAAFGIGGRFGPVAWWRGPR